MNPLQQLAWRHIGIATRLLRMIREKEKHALTPGERDDLAHAAASAKRVIAVALGDLRCRNPIR